MTIYSLPPLLSIVSFLSLAILILARGARTRINRLFFILCLLASLIYSNALFSSITRSAQNALMASRVEHFFIPLLLPLYIAFFLEYLRIAYGKRIVRLAYGYAAGLILLAPTNFYIPHVVKHAFGYTAAAGPLYFLFPLGEVATTVYILVLLGRSFRGTTRTRKNRLKYVLVGFGSLGLLNGLNFLTIHGIPLYPPGNFSFLPLTIFAIGLFKHDLLDMGVLVRKSLIYSCLTAFLTCLYAVLVMVVNRVFAQYMQSGSLLIPVGFFLLIAFIFGPMKSFIQRLVDKLFDKGTYHYRDTLKELSHRIVSELDPGAIAQRVLIAVEEAMKVEHAALFIRNREQKGHAVFSDTIDGTITLSEEDALVRLLKRQTHPVALKNQPNIKYAQCSAATKKHRVVRNAVWAFPLLFHHKLNGVLLLGEKRFGNMFSREDLDLLETVCSQSALALENAFSYQKIARLNSQLEKKVADRTKKLTVALREKEKTQEQLIRSESLAAVGQLVAGVAHELNNPLTSAISLIQSMVEDLHEQQPGKNAWEPLLEDLAFVEKELDRAKTIVRSLLGLSRQTDTYKETVDLNAVVKDACRILYNQSKQTGLNMDVSLDDNLPYISGNFATLGQVILNLLQNAIQAVTGNGGGIVLSTRFDSRNRKLFFECTDTGPGIPSAIQKDIFKPFFTTKDVGQGTGLGLYISHEIVRKHGGNLTFESKSGEGCRFIVELPAED